MTCRGEMDTIDSDTLAEMLAEQDAVASTFWTYPSAEWQMDFQARWLGERGWPLRVVCDGRVYGLLSDDLAA